MRSASEIADAFEERRKQRVKELEAWVQDNPQWWAIALATAGATAMEFTAGYVDVLRLGEGTAEGGLKGYGSDALRLLAVLGPIGRLGSRLSPLARQLMLQRGLRLAVRPTGVTGPCTFQAVNNVAQLAKGMSLFVTLGDIAAALGKRLSRVPRTAKGDFVLAAFVDDLLPVMRRAGLRCSQVVGLKSVGEVIKLTRGTQRVVVFAFEVTVKARDGARRVIRHSVIAFRDAGGDVRFADYGGQVFDSLTSLVARWGTPTRRFELMQKDASAVAVAADALDALSDGLALFVNVGPVAVLEGVHLLETDEEGAQLALPVELAAAAVSAAEDPAPPDVVQQSFENFVRRTDGEPPLTDAPGAKARAPRPDWLTGVQYRLNHLGYGAGPVDGVMGPRTQRAVRRFQAAHRPLQVDGMPGPQTQARLVQVAGY